jgi:uncharacterized membrane protein
VDQSNPLEKRLFATRLTPYRSMTPRGARNFVVAFALLNLVISLPFFIKGAWPVAGFLGLDALALSIAFEVSFRSARIYETVDLTPLELVFARVGAGGARREWRFNPNWTRLEQQAHEEFGTEHVTLVSRGERVEIGAFLGPEQKAQLARDLGKALALARLGARFG